MPVDAASQWVAISSLVVALAVLIFGAIQYRQAARKEYVEELARRVDECERRHAIAERAREDCERDRERLARLSTDLMLDMRRQADERIRKEEDQG